MPPEGLVLHTLTTAGAAYLIWLGVGTLRHPAGPQASTDEAMDSSLRQALKGAGISGLNPKVLLLFLALLPQFANDDARWRLGVQILVLGLVHVASCAVVYSAVASGARVVLRARPAAARIVTRTSGLAMIGIGILLVAERLVVR